jgi:3-methyl-2-oxobutanoate hydroxymethyltransferase
MKNKVTLPMLRQKKERGEKIVMLTCYDAPFAHLLEDAGVDILLVGDSLGDNVLGYENTLPVTMEEMLHHTAAVHRGASRPLLISDMPFMSYQVNVEDALKNAGRLVKEAGAEGVKLEGGEAVASTVCRITNAGIPVMGHLGLTPQSVKILGGYRVQGRDEKAAERIMRDAKVLEDAGAFAVVLELIPAELAHQITESLTIPTIGIGSGAFCDGQVLVLHDMLGINPDRSLRHVHRYTEVGEMVKKAVSAYAEDVRSGNFPGIENSFI